MELKVGDRIYKMRWGSISNIFKIDRVSNTLAFSGNRKFKKVYSSSYHIELIGRDEWDNTTYALENSEMKAKLHRQNLLNRISKTKFETLSDEQLQAIENIINTQNENQK